MQYILNETEMQEFIALRKENSKLSNELAVASHTCEAHRQQIANLNGLIAQAKQSIKERDERIEAFKFAKIATDKKLAEQTHELLVKDAELADLSSKLRDVKSENVCIVTNPRNGHVRVVSVTKTDAFRQHGWIVSEEYHVDRPA